MPPRADTGGLLFMARAETMGERGVVVLRAVRGGDAALEESGEAEFDRSDLLGTRGFFEAFLASISAFSFSSASRAANMGALAFAACAMASASAAASTSAALASRSALSASILAILARASSSARRFSSYAR